MKKMKIWAVCFAAALTVFTLYAVLRVFVLPKSFQENASEMNMAMFENESTVALDDENTTEGSGEAAERPERRTAERDDEEDGEAAQRPERRTAERDDEEEDGEAAQRPERQTDADESIEEDDEREDTRQRYSQNRSSNAWGGNSWSRNNNNEAGGMQSESDNDDGGARRGNGENRTGSTQNSGNRWSGSSFEYDESVEIVELTEDNNSYEDENIKIHITEYEEEGVEIYVADIKLTSAQYLKTAFANDTYGRNITDTTSAIAKAHDAILAVNGDYYGTQEKGYVIRNGIVYRSIGNGKDILCVYADGTMDIMSSDDYTPEELVEMGVWQAFCFGPKLVYDGEVTVSEGRGNGRIKNANPRTAIGMIEANHFVFVVADGRTDESSGLTLYELAAFMQELGVKCAYNLDGGGSSTMVFNGDVINHPSTGGDIMERSVSDIVYIG